MPGLRPVVISRANFAILWGSGQLIGVCRGSLTIGHTPTQLRFWRRRVQRLVKLVPTQTPFGAAARRARRERRSIIVRIVSVDLNEPDGALIKINLWVVWRADELETHAAPVADYLDMAFRQQERRIRNLEVAVFGATPGGALREPDEGGAPPPQYSAR